MERATQCKGPGILPQTEGGCMHRLGWRGPCVAGWTQRRSLAHYGRFTRRLGLARRHRLTQGRVGVRLVTLSGVGREQPEVWDE